MSRALLIADLPWLLYRAFFALPKSIVGADGQPVNALLGAVNAILSFYEGRLTAPGPRCVAACTGAEQANYRVALYPPYHAHRDPMPEALAAQWRRAPELLERLGWSVFDGGELEADDVMLSLACAEREAGGSAILVTGDRDLYGAVGERVSVAALRKGHESELIGPQEVRTLYGVSPELVPDLIALRGDPSDGLPGARGVGAKTAAELLSEHGSLESVLEAADETLPPMRPRLAATLREQAELLRTFKRIATLQRIEVERPPDREPDYAAGAQAARELGMRRLAERLERGAAPTA